MSTYDDETPLEFFDEPETLEAPQRQRRRMRPPRPGGPRRPAPPPPGAVALARLAGFVALAIAVVVGLVFWVGSCQGKSTYDQYKSYMDSVRPIAQSSASTGTTALADAIRSAKTATDLQGKLEQWSRLQQQDYDDALTLVPPASLQAAHQEILATLQLRAIGMANLADTLAGAGSKSAAEVATELVKQSQLLTASDLVWSELFRLPANQAMKRAGVVGVIAPPSQLIVTPEVITFRSFEVGYRRINVAKSSSTCTTGNCGSALLGTTAGTGTGAQTLSSSSPTTVDVSASLSFNVTFENAGTVDEGHIPVTLTVSLFGKPLRTEKHVVAFLGKQAKTTVSFQNLKLPTSAFAHQAIVRVAIGKVPGENTLANNSASYPVFFSLSSNG